MLDAWLNGFLSLMHAQELMFLTLGMATGLIMGLIPGLGGTTVLALLTPLTFGMEPISALALAGGAMGAVPMGGSITAILLNTPGTHAQAVTCLDGFPLAQQGKAGTAIGASASANAIGGIIGTITVLLILPVAKELVLAFGPPEFFLMAILGLVIVSTASRGKMLRGLMMGGFGLMLAFVGYNDVTGGQRFTFGIEYLWDGFPLVPTLMGFFTISQMIDLTIRGGAVSRDPSTVKITNMMSGVWETLRHWKALLRGSLVGSIVGCVPGIGAGVASFVSYSMTVQASKHPETFGKGNIEGVIAPEAAINAKDGSNLIPTLAFGLPGGAEMAVFMGILVLHGMTPGPLMLMEHQTEIYSLIWALTTSCILAAIVGVLFVRPLSMVTLIDSRFLAPGIIAVAMIGSYAVNRNIWDVVVAAVTGILGYFMIRYDYPRLTIVISLVLGEIAERNFHQAHMMSGGSVSVYLSRPICEALLALIALMLLSPAYRALKEALAARRLAAEGKPS